VALCIGADEQRQRDVGQLPQDASMPERRTFLARRKVAAVPIDARVAEPHGHNGDTRLVVEGFTVEMQPVSQAGAAAVVPGNAALVHFRAGRLADDEEARARLGPQHRARSQRQGVGADAAGADFAEQRLERRHACRPERAARDSARRSSTKAGTISVAGPYTRSVKRLWPSEGSRFNSTVW